MQTKYTIQTKFGNINSGKAARGFILENGSQIAQFKRDGKDDLGYISPIEVKWFSERAKARFEDFCNCLSISETIEAIAGINQ